MPRLRSWKRAVESRVVYLCVNARTVACPAMFTCVSSPRCSKCCLRAGVGGPTITLPIFHFLATAARRSMVLDALSFHHAGKRVLALLRRSATECDAQYKSNLSTTFPRKALSASAKSSALTSSLALPASCTPAMASQDVASILLEEKTPTPAEHFHLRKEAGLTPPPQPENKEALERSWYCVTLRDASQDNEAVGMGRLVGDGMFLFVTDMAVLPAYQGRGLGSKILQALLAHVDQHAPRARLALEGDPPGVRLYERHGFSHQTYSKPML